MSCVIRLATTMDGEVMRGEVGNYMRAKDACRHIIERGIKAGKFPEGTQIVEWQPFSVADSDQEPMPDPLDASREYKHSRKYFTVVAPGDYYILRSQDVDLQKQIHACLQAENTSIWMEGARWETGQEPKKVFYRR